MLTWIRTGLSSNAAAPATYTQDGGRTYANISLPDASSTWQYGLSSPMGGACLIFSYSASTSVITMQQWNPTTYAWQSYVPGFPSTVAHIYQGDMNVNRAAWLAVQDSSAGYQVYTWTAGGIPFYLVASTASVYCSTYKLQALGSLPSLNALAALAVAPYHLLLYRSSECVGSVDLVTGTANQIWSIASTSTANPYSITAYSILVASGPIGCGLGSACSGATAGGKMYTAVVSSANDAALLTKTNWGSFSMPNGGGVNLVQCYYTVALTLPAYCYAAASWNPPVSIYSGACNAATSGYSFYTASNSAPTSSSSWSEVGCAPLVAHSIVIVDYATIHLSGFELGGGATVAAYYSSNRGASWTRLTALPDYFGSAGTSGAYIKTLQMAFKGGPVLLSGMDPSFHCTASGYTSASTCPTATYNTLLNVANCNSVLKIGAVAMSYSNRGDENSVAFLGTFLTSSTSTIAGASFLAWETSVCLGWSRTFWSTFYTSTSYPQIDRGGTIDEFFTALMAGTINPRLIFIHEVLKSVNGITQLDINAINTYALALARFVSTGGGLYVVGFQGPGTGTGTGTSVNFGYLATLTPKLALKVVNGVAPSVTADGTSNFPTLTSNNIASPWHTSFGGGSYGNCAASSCSFGVLSCLAYETLSSFPECALVGGASISFNYGTQSQTITCISLGGPYWGYFNVLGIPVYCYTSSGLTVTVSSTTTSACTYVSSSFPGTYSTGYLNTTSTGGTCTLIVTQTGDQVYAAAVPVTISCAFGPISLTAAPSPTSTFSQTLTSSRTFSVSTTASTTLTRSTSHTRSPSRSASPTFSRSSSASPSVSPFPSHSSTSTQCLSATITPTLSPCPSMSRTGSLSNTHSLTQSRSASVTLSSSHSPSFSISVTLSRSPSRSPSSSGCTSVSRTSTPSACGSLSPTLSVTSTQTPSSSVRPTVTTTSSLTYCSW